MDSKRCLGAIFNKVTIGDHSRYPEFKAEGGQKKSSNLGIHGGDFVVGIIGSGVGKDNIMQRAYKD